MLTRNAPTKLDRRAPRRTRDIGAVRNRVDGAFGFEKARGWRRSRSKFASTTREFFKFPNFLNAFRFSFSQKVCALASDAVHKNVRRRRNARSSLRGVWHRGCARSASLSRKFGEKMREFVTKFFAILTRNAATKLGRRAPRRTHDVGAFCDRVIGAFSFEKACGWRRSRSKFASTTREYFLNF